MSWLKRYPAFFVRCAELVPSPCVVYDPADLTEITIEYEGHEPWRARELVIGERAGKRPPLPDYMGAVPADSSRLLTAAEERHRDRREQQAPAVAYRRVSKEERHV